MVSRKAQPVELTDDGVPILPERLAVRPLTSAEDAERREWFASHGVAMLDVHAIRRIILASCRFHRLPFSSLDRARVKAVGLAEWRRRQASEP